MAAGEVEVAIEAAVVNLREDFIPLRRRNFRLAEPHLRKQVPVETRAEKTTQRRTVLGAELKNHCHSEDDSQKQSEAPGEELRLSEVIVHCNLLCDEG